MKPAVLEAQLADALARLQILESAPTLQRHIGDARLRSKIRAQLDAIDGLVAADPAERGKLLAAMRPPERREIVELTPFASRITIARDLGSDGRRLLRGALDLDAAQMLAAALAVDVPDLVRIRAPSGVVEYSILDARGRHASGFAWDQSRTLVEERAAWAARVESSAELADHVAAGRLVLEPVDEASARKWILSALNAGTLEMSDDLEITAAVDEPEVPDGLGARDASSAITTADRASRLASLAAANG